MTISEHLFYDSTCGFCSGFARFVQRRDPAGVVFKLAPMDSEEFNKTVSEQQRATLPDSAIVRRNDGELLLEWTMAVHVFKRLGGQWALLGWMMGLMPLSVGNGIYRFIARNRKRFGRGRASCDVR